MIDIILFLALLANLVTVLLWRYQLAQHGAVRGLLILAMVICFAVSTYLFSIPYAWARAPFIALGALGLSGWLCVFAYPLISALPRFGQERWR